MSYSCFYGKISVTLIPLLSKNQKTADSYGMAVKTLDKIKLPVRIRSAVQEASNRL